MNKGGGGMGSGAGGAAGPTTAAAAAAAQKQKTLLQRVDTDVGGLVDNFGFLVNVARVQAADSLLKLVSELKQTAVFSGFASLNDHVDQRTEEFNKLTEDTNGILSRIGEETAASLKELEQHYYSSTLRTSISPQP
ncbi:mediator of RNA polymerase II transcription subunit 22b-like isoform X2 [Salvia miltiorrhiza]|uniref:mediator of RNA polymerase II transcription subunit 22b-like isoform X2 n=1 Tax=Salvia miltiorrhiza TaxID=226208 RepID=UPI0025AC5B0B|nr:mediator of RNA polymerase II transcription subunit 22b-like isoform X2 [Salvia miltiorrhiza]